MNKGNLRICFWYILMTALLSLSACGREERQRGMDGYLYEAQQLSDTENWIQTFKSDGTWIYYISSDGCLYRIPLGEDGQPSISEAEKIPDTEKILDYTLDAEGNMYHYSADTIYPENGSSGIKVKNQVLAKYNPNGTLDYSLPLSDRQATYKYLHSNGGYLAADKNGNAFLLTGDLIFVADTEGKFFSEIHISSILSEEGDENAKLLEGENGRVYCLTSSSERRTLYELVEDGSSYRLQILSMNGLTGNQSMTFNHFYSSPKGILYSGTDGILYCYNAEKDTWQQLLRWNDSNLNRDADQLLWLSENQLLASYRIPYSSQSQIFLLNRKNVEELPEKEELLLVCWECPQKLEKAITHFNRENEQYHITLQLYQEDAWLDSKLLSTDPPDILLLYRWDIEKYGTKQALEDLTPYLEKSEKLKKDDFVENPLKCYTINGKLVGIPSEFSCYTLRVHQSEMLSEAGWTLQDVMELTDNYPERKLNNRSFRWNLENFCGNYVMDTFVDQKTGICRFDTDEFRQFIQWLADHSGSLTELDYVLELKNPLTAQTWVSNIQEYLLYVSRPEEKTLSIGFPSSDGTPQYRGGTFNALSILSKSRHKEGAWQFIEYFLSFEEHWDNKAVSPNMPTRKDLLYAMLEYAMSPDYFDGDIIKEEPGSPGMYPKWFPTSYMNMEGDFVQTDTVYYYATQEEVDGLLQIISQTDFSLTSALETNMFDIIAQEAEGYFGGNKSLDEVSKLIQNRISILMQENIR